MILPQHRNCPQSGPLRPLLPPDDVIGKRARHTNKSQPQVQVQSLFRYFTPLPTYLLSAFVSSLSVQAFLMCIGAIGRVALRGKRKKYYPTKPETFLQNQ